MSDTSLTPTDVKELLKAITKLTSTISTTARDNSDLKKAVDVLASTTNKATEQGKLTGKAARDQAKSDRDHRKEAKTIDAALIDSLTNLSTANQEQKKALLEAIAHAKANVKKDDKASQQALKATEKDYLAFHNTMSSANRAIAEYSDSLAEQTGKQLQLEKQSAEISLKEGKSASQRWNAQKNLLGIQQKIATNDLAASRAKTDSVRQQFNINASVANKTALMQAELEEKKARIAEAASKSVAGQLTTMSPLFATLAQRTKQLIAGFSLGKAVGTLYGDMGTQRSTGGSNAILQGTELTSSILGNYMTAVVNGVDTKVMMELRQTTRAAELSAGSQAKFDSALFDGIESLKGITENATEALQLKAGIMSAVQEVGISAQVSGEMVNGLTEQFGKLSRLTGQSAASIAKMTEGIIKDTDQRAIMLSMGEQQKAQYLLEQVQRVAQYKMAGYSLEQAQELIKIQAAERNKKSIDKYKSHYSALQAREILVGQLGQHGAEGRQRATSVSDTNAKIKQLDAQAAANKWTADSEEGRKYKAERAMLEGKIAEHVEFLKGRNQAASGTMGGNEPITDWLSETLKANSPNYNVVNTGAKNDAQTAAKAGEANANKNSTMTAMVSTIVDRVSSLAGSPLFQGGVALLVAGSTLKFHYLATKYMLSKLGGGAGIWDSIKDSTRRGKTRMGRKSKVAIGRLGQTMASSGSMLGRAGSAIGSGLGRVGGLAASGLGAVKSLALPALAAAATGYLFSRVAESQEQKGNTKTAASLDVASSALKGAGMGSSIGLVFPPAAIPGAAIGGLVGAGMGMYDNWGKLFSSKSTTGPSSALLNKPTPTAVVDVQSEQAKKEALDPTKTTTSATVENLLVQIAKLIELLTTKPDDRPFTKELLEEYKRNGSNARINAGLYSQVPVRSPS